MEPGDPREREGEEDMLTTMRVILLPIFLAAIQSQVKIIHPSPAMMMLSLFLFFFYIYAVGSIIGGGEYFLQLNSASNLWSQVSLVYTKVRKYHWHN